MRTETLTNSQVQRRVAAILIFAALTALTARITFHLPFTPVPITAQTLAVILSGLVLGARGGLAAQLVYLGLVAGGLPFDANGLGPLAFFGPTAGYLIGFAPAAWLTGYLAERLTTGGNFIAAVGGILVIYLGGTVWLALSLGSWTAAWSMGAVPFIGPDLLKAGIAAIVAESGRLLFR